MRSTATGLEIPGVLWRRDPRAEPLPLVLDSPHSGALYPEDFAYCCPLPVLRRADIERLPCYLETGKAIDVRFYRKHGFEVLTVGDLVLLPDFDILLVSALDRIRRQAVDFVMNIHVEWHFRTSASVFKSFPESSCSAAFFPSLFLRLVRTDQLCSSGMNPEHSRSMASMRSSARR